jgi:hypothetical protein
MLNPELIPSTLESHSGIIVLSLALLKTMLGSAFQISKNGWDAERTGVVANLNFF